MVIQTHSHSSRGYPFCINGICSNALDNIQQRQQQMQLQQQLPQQQQWQGHVVHASDAVPNSNLLVHTSTQFEKQGEEIAYFFRLQNEQMKIMLENQRKQQMATFRNMENIASQILAQKEEELAQAAKKKQELEGLLIVREAEKRNWRRMALERETTLITLRAKLEEEKKRVRILMENDAESCCGENEERRDQKRLRRENNQVFCRKCNKNISDVLFLLCKDCDASLHSYPLCGVEKKSNIEINNLI